MQFTELSINPISHNTELNPALWQGHRLRKDARHKLLQIAKHFAEFLNTPIKLKDITVSGSNAGYNYSEYSDIDLHLVVKTTPAHAELFTAKKNQYNFTYDIKLNGVPVELYVQSADQPHHSAGIYSVLNDHWISEPDKSAPDVSVKDIRSKARNYAGQINQALRSDDLQKAKDTMAELRRLRQAGLEANGESSVENLAFKLLRARGQIDKLRKYITKLESAELSLGEHNEN
jgi:predicted nucleotidyltransferase